MILAAGRGERMGDLTEDRPKPLLGMGAETLIERHLRCLAQAGIREVVVNLSYRAGMIRAALGDVSKWKQKIFYSDEGEPPLETGGGIINALPLLGSGPFVLVNADVLTDFDFSTLGCARDAGCLVLVSNPPHHSQGDFGLAATGTLTSTPPLLTYSGIAVLDPSLFAAATPGRQPLRPILDAAIERGVLRGVLYRGLWRDVGTPERLHEARRLLRDPV